MSVAVKGYPLLVAVPCPRCGVMQVYTVKRLEDGGATLKENCRNCGEPLEITVNREKQPFYTSNATRNMTVMNARERILAYMEEKGTPVSSTELSEELGISKNTVYYNTTILIAAEKIERYLDLAGVFTLKTSEVRSKEDI